MSSFEQSVVCPVLVGRTAQVAALRRLCEQVQNGSGRTVLLSGEAGVGKSRLAAEATHFGAAAGWTMLRGMCSEAERTLPFGVLVDLLRAYSLSRPPGTLAEQFGADAPLFVPLLPELAGPSGALGGGVALDKQLIFPAVARLCAHLARDRGLLVTIEDIHWCDEVSLELLLYLARHTAALPVLLVCTYRSDEGNDELRRLLAQLDRQRLAHEITLMRLPPAEVDAMLRAIFAQAQPIRAEFLNTLYALTDGNPFFVEETLKTMLAAGEIFYADGRWDRKPVGELQIPRSVEETLHRRSRHLSEPARTLLTLAAVVGQRCEFRLLQRLTGWDEAEVLVRLKELISAQFLVEESADLFAFRHALTRQAASTLLLARERRQLHRTIALALIDLAGDQADAPLAELAYHCFAGELWAEALDYARRAAERALALFAPAAARTHIERAMIAAERMGQSPGSALFLLRGRAAALLSDFQAARDAFEAAERLAAAGGDQRAVWEALIALGDLWAVRDYRQTGDYFARALAHARQLGDDAALGATLNHVGNWQMNQERPAEALQQHREALAIFERLDDRLGIAQTCDLLAITTYNAGDLLGGRAYYERALALWRALDDRRGLLFTLGGLALGLDYRFEVGHAGRSQSLTWAEESVQMGRVIGWRAGEALALIVRGLVQVQGGVYGLALADFRAALGIAEEIEHRGWQADSLHGLGKLYLDLLAPDAAQACLTRALALAHELHSMIWVRHSAALLAQAAIARGELERADVLLDTALGADEPPSTLGTRLLLAVRVERFLAGGMADAALTLVRRLAERTANRDAGAAIPAPYLHYLHGRALAAAGRIAEATAALEHARDIARAQQRPDGLWRACAELARLYALLGRSDDAGREAAAAREAIDGIVRTLTTPEADAEARQLAEQFAQRAPALLPPLGAPADPAEALTPREREVALLVAAGKTNRDIAAALVLSERTAERHVANIMAKLSFGSRAQVAVWATTHLREG